MLVIFVVSIILLIGALLVGYSLKNKARFKKEILPLQIKLVNELLKEINSSKVEVLIIEEEDNYLNKYNRFKGLTLFEIGKCIDNTSDLSSEKYEDYNVFLEDPCRIINIQKYLFNKYMPKDIQNELRAFNTHDFEKIVSPPSPCIILTEKGNKANDNEREFMKIHAESYESWQQFKESAHSLNFVIRQWLKENTPLEKEEGVFAL